MARFFGISDIHIRDSKDPAYRKLLNLISKSSAGDVFFLGGDIFDFLVEDQPSQTRELAEFFNALDSRSQAGVRFLYVEGNHDFHLGYMKKRIQKLEVDPESFSIEFEGKRFYLAHGDLVDQEDRKYLMLRSFFRSRFIHTAARILPERVVAKIGEKSDTVFGDQDPRLLDERGLDRQKKSREKFHTFARKKFLEGYDFVVLGHCHDLDEERVVEGGKNFQYINIGYPKKHSKFIFWEPGMSSIERRDF